MTSIPSGDDLRQRLQRALGAKYEIARSLGSGGFGQVFAAWEALPKRWVAVKCLRPEHDPLSRAADRFRREIEILASLRHPNIVPAYEIGQHEDLLFCVMPLVDGGTLSDALRKAGSLSLPETTRIVTETASALQEAHDRGVVHRDVKPTNIMFDGASRHVILVDFGIARLISDTASVLTAPGMVVGSPWYVSPEQVTGEAADERSDQYSLALVCFEMLTGKVPFAASRPEEALIKRLGELAPSVRTFRPDAPVGVDEVLARALDTQPARRFPTIRDFAAAWQAATEARTSGDVHRRLVLSGGSARRKVRVRMPESGELIIGRSPRADVALVADDHVSSRHCRLFWDGARLTVEDLGSRNGTYVNSARTMRAALAPGDTLRIGATTLVVAEEVGRDG